MKNIEFTLNTVEIAEMLDNTPHKDILKKLEGRTDKNGKHTKGYIEILTERQMSPSEFFIPSTYKDSSGKENKCYLITKKGCEFLANKFTGEKGVLFTARYINRFHEMEDEIQKKTAPSIQASDLSGLASVVESVMVRQNCYSYEIAKVINQLFKQFGVKLPKEFVNAKSIPKTECTTTGKKKKIADILEKINDERFLDQIRTILKLHIERKGASA